MRSYPRNSPQAAARLLALAMIADGHVCRSELDAVREAAIDARIGLGCGELGDVLRTLCEDLLQSSPHAGSLASAVDASLIDAFAREVDAPELQGRVMAAIVTAAAADGHLSDGEQVLLDSLRRAWTAGPPVTSDPVPA